MNYFTTAAHWWADKIRNVIPGNRDAGDIDKFEKGLADEIRNYVEKHGYMILSVDYDPDFILSMVAEENGIDLELFPWKTAMWIDKERVSVRWGYGAPTETIFPEE